MRTSARGAGGKFCDLFIYYFSLLGVKYLRMWLRNSLSPRIKENGTHKNTRNRESVINNNNLPALNNYIALWKHKSTFTIFFNSWCEVKTENACGDFKTYQKKKKIQLTVKFQVFRKVENQIN